MIRRFQCIGLLLALAVVAGCKSSPPDEPSVCTVSNVSVTPSPGTVASGATAQFSAAVTQQHCTDLTTTWDTGNHALATVSSSGLVTGVAEGTTTVLATAGGRTGSVALTVTAPLPTCHVSAVIVSPPVNDLLPSESVALTATVTQVSCTGLVTSWTSNNEAVAVVGSTGVVTAVAPGTATITALAGTVGGTATIRVASPSFGSTWSTSVLRVAGSASSPTGFSNAAWAASPTDAFIASNGELFRYSAGAWSRFATSGSGVSAMWGSSSTDVFGVGQRILHWNGTAWTAMTSPTTETLQAVWGSSSGNIFAVGRGGAIIRYNGTSWSSVASPTSANLTGVSGSGPGFALAVTDAGEVLRFDGTSWSVQAHPATFLNAVWVSSPTDAYAVGDPGHVYHFDGAIWTDIPVPTSGTLTAVWGSASANVYVAGQAGYAAHFDGLGWTTIPPQTGADFLALAGSGAGVFGLGDGFVVSLTPGSETLLSYAPALNSVWAVDANTAFAVGDGGTVWKYSSGTWQLQPTGVLYRLTDVWAASATQAIAVGNKSGSNIGVVLRYNGTSWTEATIPISSGLAAVWGPSINDVIAVSRFTSLISFDGSAWTPAAPGPGDVINLWGTSATEYTLVGASGFAARFDGVATVTPLASAPTTDALISVWGSSPTDYFAGTNNGAMFHFNGTAWSPMTVATQGSISGIWGTGPSEVFALTSDGEIGKFNGTTWSRVKLADPDLQFKAIHGTPTRLFAVGAAGAVMVTP